MVFVAEGDGLLGGDADVAGPAGAGDAVGADDGDDERDEAGPEDEPEDGVRAGCEELAGGMGGRQLSGNGRASVWSDRVNIGQACRKQASARHTVSSKRWFGWSQLAGGRDGALGGGGVLVWRGGSGLGGCGPLGGVQGWLGAVCWVGATLTQPSPASGRGLLGLGLGLSGAVWWVGATLTRPSSASGRGLLVRFSGRGGRGWCGGAIAGRRWRA